MKNFHAANHSKNISIKEMCIVCEDIMKKHYDNGTCRCLSEQYGTLFIQDQYEVVEGEKK